MLEGLCGVCHNLWVLSTVSIPGLGTVYQRACCLLNSCPALCLVQCNHHHHKSLEGIFFLFDWTSIAVHTCIEIIIHIYLRSDEFFHPTQYGKMPRSPCSTDPCVSWTRRKLHRSSRDVRWVSPIRDIVPYLTCATNPHIFCLYQRSTPITKLIKPVSCTRGSVYA